MLEKDQNAWNLSHLFPWISAIDISPASCPMMENKYG